MQQNQIWYHWFPNFHDIKSNLQDLPLILVTTIFENTYRLFTDTSELIHFYFLVFFFSNFLAVGYMQWIKLTYVSF